MPSIPPSGISKEALPEDRQSVMETASSPVDSAMRWATYLQFPVAEKYSIMLKCIRE